MIQTDAPISPGSSGGALLNGGGDMVGLVTAVGSGEGSGVGFATPVDVARMVAAQLIEDGTVTWVWLGIHGTDVDLATAERVGMATGALVREVVADGPAARAGLAAGDVIVALDGAPVASMSALVVGLRTHGPGDTVEIGYLRDGARLSAVVALDARG
jgi:S1-C subfamily serine protease